MATLHDNYAYIDSDKIQQIEVVKNTWMVTEGQPIDPPPDIRKKNNEFLICFKSGRKKSQTVAHEFNGETGGAGHVFSPFTMGSARPAELNFCFGLALQWASGGSTTIYLGQGSTMSRNNWWIGADAIEVHNETATIESPEGETFRISGYSAQTAASAEASDRSTMASSASESGAQAGIPPALAWLIKEVGEKVAKEIAKLVNANVNSFKIIGK